MRMQNPEIPHRYYTIHELGLLNYGLICSTEKYIQMFKDHRVRGYLFEQQNYTEGKK